MKQAHLFPELPSDQNLVSEVVNVASVPKRSPFRYPGGKTWLVPLFKRWIRSFDNRPKLLIEPFAGGGIISLTALFENLVDRVLMVELDKQIAAVWQAVVDGEGEWLAKRILNFELTRENVLAELSIRRNLTREIAFQTILKNRTFHGGILAEGSGFLKYGENGRGIFSRWYPQTIATRIRHLSFIADRIEFISGDGFKVLADHSKDASTIFFIDPPYTAGGKKAGARLYTHYELDHEHLFKVCERLKGDFLMTYDNAEEVRHMARQHGFQMKPVAMKNTHHANMTELLVGRNLSWLRDRPIIHESSPIYKTQKSHRKRVKKQLRNAKLKRAHKAGPSRLRRMRGSQR